MFVVPPASRVPISGGDATQRPYDVNCVNKDLNQKITQKEILDCTKRLKNNKVSGDDRVINEYIKFTPDKFIDVYEDFLA
jgi:hypothetical protein